MLLINWCNLRYELYIHKIQSQTEAKKRMEIKIIASVLEFKAHKNGK